LGDEIELLIRATEYPHRIGASSLSVNIIRDADLAQVFSVAWLQQIIFGLAAEWNQSPIDVLREEEGFIRAMRFSTDWAKAIFMQAVIDAKAEEIAAFLAILSEKIVA
jgi:hypothetical protein